MIRGVLERTRSAKGEHRDFGDESLRWRVSPQAERSDHNYVTLRFGECFLNIGKTAGIIILKKIIRLALSLNDQVNQFSGDCYHLNNHFSLSPFRNLG